MLKFSDDKILSDIGDFAVFFKYQHAYTKEYHEIKDISHFMIECLVQTEPKHGIRTISSDTIYQGA